MSALHRPDLVLWILVSLECISGFAFAEGLRLLIWRTSPLKQQFPLAIMLGLVVYGLNVLNLVVKQRTGYALPSLSGCIDNLVGAVLLFPVMAIMGWVGILDARKQLLAMRERRKSSSDHSS